MNVLDFYKQSLSSVKEVEVPFSDWYSICYFNSDSNISFHVFFQCSLDKLEFAMELYTDLAPHLYNAWLQSVVFHCCREKHMRDVVIFKRDELLYASHAIEHVLCKRTGLATLSDIGLATARKYLAFDEIAGLFVGVYRKPIDALTTTESLIAMNLTLGMTNKEISSNLSLSEKTVRNRLSTIYKKLEVKNRTHAIKILSEVD